MHRVLLVAENVSLSQVVRLVSLGRRLDPTRYEVHFACGEFHPLIFGGTEFRRWPLTTIDRQRALACIAQCQPLYDEAMLRAYVGEELALLEAVRPALVVGDYRFSLSTSAEVAGVRCATLTNAYNSPYYVRDELPVPDYPLVDVIGTERFKRYFPDVMAKGLALHTEPVNATRRHYGLAPIEDYLHVLTHGDLTLHPDVPELCPTRDPPPSHHYLGHVAWAPDVAFDAELARWSAEQPFVYVTLGSTGRVSALPLVLEALGRLPLRALLATADRALPGELPANVRAASYVPGHLAARAARFVITNGGASTSYQALAEGKPVLGIASNLDQYMAMDAIEQAGAGLLLRAGTLAAETVTAAVVQLLESTELSNNARAVGQAFARRNCDQRFAEILEFECARSV